MGFELVHRRPDGSRVQHFPQHRDVQVAHADPLHQAGPLQLLHRAPRVGVRHRDGLQGWLVGRRIEKPLGRIAHIEWHVSKSDGEMDQVQVQHVQAQISQRAFARRANVLRFVVGVPQLGGDPEVVPEAKPFLHDRRQPRTHLGLIAVVAGAIKMPVPEPNRLANHRRPLRLGQLPSAQTEGGQPEGGEGSIVRTPLAFERAVRHLGNILVSHGRNPAPAHSLSGPDADADNSDPGVRRFTDGPKLGTVQK